MHPTCGTSRLRKARGLGVEYSERPARHSLLGVSYRRILDAELRLSQSHSSHIRRASLGLKGARAPCRKTISPMACSRLDSCPTGAACRSARRATRNWGYRTANSWATSMVWSVEPSSTTRTSNRSVKSERMSKMCWRLSLRVRSALQTGSTTLRERFTSDPFQNDVAISGCDYGKKPVNSQPRRARKRPFCLSSSRQAI